jgi:hypothetical protein
MILDQFINFKPAGEFHVFKITKTDFLGDMDEKLPIIHVQAFTYKISCIALPYKLVPF